MPLCSEHLCSVPTLYSEPVLLSRRISEDISDGHKSRGWSLGYAANLRWIEVRTQPNIPSCTALLQKKGIIESCHGRQTEKPSSVPWSDSQLYSVKYISESFFLNLNAKYIVGPKYSIFTVFPCFFLSLALQILIYILLTPKS